MFTNFSECLIEITSQFKPIKSQHLYVKLSNINKTFMLLQGEQHFNTLLIIAQEIKHIKPILTITPADSNNLEKGNQHKRNA